MFTRLQQAWKAHRSALPQLFAKKLLAKFVRAETLVFYRRELAGGLPDLRSSDVATRVVRIEALESELFRGLCAKYPDRNFHARLQGAGRQCYVAVRDTRVVGYAWVATTSVYIDEIKCEYPVPAGEAFIYDCFVDSTCRGSGIYPAMLGAVLRNSRESTELQVATIAASSLNHASNRGITKAGFSEWKRIYYLECRGKQRWWERELAAASAVA